MAALAVCGCASLPAPQSAQNGEAVDETRSNPLLELLPPLRAGDVVLIGADIGFLDLAGTWSAPDRQFGHVGIVVPVIGGDFVLIVNVHGSPLDPEGPVERDTLSSFAKDATRIGVLRARDPAMGEKMAAAAMTYLDPRFTFDSDFQLYSRDEIYCTELVWRVLIDVLGYDPFPKKDWVLFRDAISPTMLEQSALFEEVFFAGTVDGKTPPPRGGAVARS
jgi:hypothetical protein